MPPPAYPRLSPQAVILAERIARRAGADHVRVDFMTHDVGLAGVGLGGSLVFGELTFTTVRTPAPPLTSPPPPKAYYIDYARKRRDPDRKCSNST